MNTLFLSLDDAVEIAVREFGADREIAEQEFQQKCYISDDQYSIGFYDGIMKAKEVVSEILKEN